MPHLSEQLTATSTPAEAFERDLHALQPDIAAAAGDFFEDALKDANITNNESCENDPDTENRTWTPPPPPPHPVIQSIANTINHHLANGYQMNDFPDDLVIEAFLENARPHFKDRKTYMHFLAKIEEAVDQTEREEDGISGYAIGHIIRKVQGKELSAIFQTFKNVEHASIEGRYQAALNAETAIKKIVTERDFTYGDSHRITSENVMNIGHESITENLTSGRSTTDGTLKIIVENILAIKNEFELRKTIGTVDREKLHEDRITYGAKGANLIALQILLKKLEGTVLEDAATRLSIPAFQLVPAELYRKWKSGEDITGELRAIYESLERDAIMVRSSAVYSEDGENTTGAGIYDSVMVNKGHTFADFMTAVMQVYASCDSERAQKYRQENDVEYEEMGLVVQKGIDGDKKGYLNSTKPHTKKLVEITYDSVGFPMAFKKIELRKLTALGRCSYLSIQHTMQSQIDLQRVNYGDVISITAGRYLAIGMAAEIYFGHPVQIEFINEIDRKTFTKNPHLLQVRPLPAKMFTEQQIELPNKPHLAEFDAMGFCDEVLEILPTTKDNRALLFGTDIDNNDKTGVVVFNGSFFASMSLGEIDAQCPKKGVVVLLTETRSGQGHIETIALEKGLVLLCNNEGNTLEQANTINQLMNHIHILTMSATERFIPGKKLHIVANGEIGRIYEAKE